MNAGDVTPALFEALRSPLSGPGTLSAEAAALLGAVSANAPVEAAIIAGGETDSVHGNSASERQPAAEKRDSLSAAALDNFLASVANTALKVRVLQFFSKQPGVCLSSAQLAERIRANSDEVKSALQELNDDGALTFCPHFGYGDLCLMNPNYHTTMMKRDIKLLLHALKARPEQIWQHFERS